MLIKFRNIGKVTNHEIKLNEINIVAGQNDTAKSTIGKALFALYTPNVVDKKEIKNNLISKLEELSGETDLNKIKSLKNVEYDNYMNLIEDENKLNSEIVKETLNQTFNNYFNNRFTNNKIELTSDLQNKSVTFKHEVDEKYVYESTDSDTKVIFIDSMLSKVDTDYFDFLKYKSRDNICGVNQMLFSYDLTEKINEPNTIKYKDEIYIILELFNKLFAFSKIECGYCHFDNYKIPLNSQASGTKNLYFIYKLVKNGHLDENAVLILDEPEDELHPEWQFAFSNIISHINKLLRCKILITTHSSEQIESVLTILGNENRLDDLSLFVSKNINNEIVITDYKNDPEMLFESLNSIYEKIDNMEFYE